MLRRVHVVVLATIVLLLVGSLGGAAGAKPSSSSSTSTPSDAQLIARARAALAQGRGTAAITPHIATPFSVTVSDPSGDATPTDDPRGDLVSAAAGEDRAGMVFKATMATPSNPATDINWAGETTLAFYIDNNFDGHFDSIALVEEVSGQLQAVLIGYVSEQSCTGSATFDGTSVSVAFARCSIGAFRFRAEVEYDTTPGNVNDVPQADRAPDAGYSSAVPLHRTGYLLETPFGFALSFGETLQVEDFDFTFSPVSIAATDDGLSVWATDAAGHVHAYGLARYRGGSPVLHAGEEVVAISAMHASQGYVLFTSEGRAFAFGTGHQVGDLAGKPLNMPVVGASLTPSGNGYYMVAGDGGVFTFGDAHFRGSTGDLRLNSPVVGIAVTADNSGYWLAAGDGGVFAFHARFRGSMGGTPLVAPVVGISRYGDGYVMAAADAGVFNFSSAPFRGSGFNVTGIGIPFPINGGGVGIIGVGGFGVNSIVAIDT